MMKRMLQRSSIRGLFTLLPAVGAMMAQETYTVTPLNPMVTEVTDGTIGAPAFTISQTPSPGSLAIRVTNVNNVTGMGQS